MYKKDSMYAIERSPEYLAHYGVRGMKWGVKKAIASGNDAKLGKQYAKAQKKLAKLEKQAGKSKKYARRAALMGVGAAAAGGLAAAGTEGVGKAMRRVGGFAGRTMSDVGSAMIKSGNRRIRNAGVGIHNAGKVANSALVKAGMGVESWGKGNTIARTAAGKYGKLAAGKGAMYNTVARDKAMSKIGGVSNNTIARIGAGAVGAGLAVGAARNAYKAATAQKRATKFKSEMNKAFAGTKYANGGGNGGNNTPRQGKRRNRK